MRSSVRLAVLVALGGCQPPAGSCNLGTAAYIGYIDLSRTDLPGAGPTVPATELGGTALFVSTADAGIDGLYWAVGSPCDGTAGSGPCCYIAPPPDAGDDSSSSSQSDLSAWNVSVVDESDPDAGVYAGDYLAADGGLTFDGGTGNYAGSLTWPDWSAGDELRVYGSGSGTVDPFGGQVMAPDDFAGLNPNLFADAGTVPLGQDLALTWIPAGASSVTIGALDEMTSGVVVCTVPDNGAFEVPGSLLSRFQSGDQGALVVSRSAQTCAYSDNASIALVAQTQTLVRVQFR